MLQAFPEIHRKARQRQVNMAVEEVVDTLGWYAQSKEGRTFHVDLEAATTNIADGWELFQMLEETIRPSFRTDFSEDWTPLLKQPGDTIVVRPVWPSFL